MKKDNIYLIKVRVLIAQKYVLNKINKMEKIVRFFRMQPNIFELAFYVCIFGFYCCYSLFPYCMCCIVPIN